MNKEGWMSNKYKYGRATTSREKAHTKMKVKKNTYSKTLFDFTQYFWDSDVTKRLKSTFYSNIF